MPPRLDVAGRLIEEQARDADLLVGLEDARGRRSLALLDRQLRGIDVDVSRAMAQVGEGSELTGGEILAMLAIASLAAQRARGVLEAHIQRGSTYASASATKKTRDLLAALEKTFSGKVTQLPSREFREAIAATGYRNVLRAIQGESLDAYTLELRASFRQALETATINGASRNATVAAVTRGKDGGIFSDKRWMAERTLRTETARVYNATVHTAMEVLPTFGIVVKKKILAIFDRKTAYDSIYVHGQIRAMGETFMDGAGREYLYPPARPNDRETIIPWKEEWREVRSTRPVPSSRMPAPPRRAELRKEPQPGSPIKILPASP